ncbi:MAG: hypothetical protein K2P85_03910 [Flavobacteriaceae bacterium]|nr:hypothetical protein [Flavobacteriaceae bacterium]
MKIISNFELLIKRILPLSFPLPTDANSPNNSVARRVVQAHFLTVSNLELDRPVYFSVSYFVSNYNLTPPSDTDLRTFVQTSSSRNFDLRYDGNGNDNSDLNIGATLTSSIITSLPFDRNYSVLKTKNILLAQGETALLSLFPNIVPGSQTPNLVNVLTQLSPGFELRGFIKIQQESNAEGETNPYITKPAQILVTSEHRGTFLDNDFPSVRELTIGAVNVGLDFDQLAYTLPLAEGKSLYILDGA